MIRPLIIYGAAPGAGDEMLEASRLMVSADILGVGLDIAREPIAFTWIVTLHPNEAGDIKERRARAGLPVVPVLSHELNDSKGNPYQVDILFPYEKPSGSSALHGALYGIQVGYSKIVLCGCPLRGKNANGVNYETFHEGWKAREELVKRHVRSMSGWTAEFLGKPTEEWLNGQ